jgi:hypothetical protein
MMEEVIHLSDLVADLKARVEALERELAMYRTTAQMAAPPMDYSQSQQLGAKWDAGTYSEEDFRG